MSSCFSVYKAFKIKKIKFIALYRVHFFSCCSFLFLYIDSDYNVAERCSLVDTIGRYLRFISSARAVLLTNHKREFPLSTELQSGQLNK